jgi:hypothetical protein
MKLKFLFIAIVALLATGCAEQVLAVPQAVIGGTVNVISAIGDALIFWD